MLLNAKAGFFWVSLTGVLLGTELAPAMTLLAVGVAVLLSLRGMGRWRWPYPAAGSPRSTLERGVGSKACWVRPWPRWA